MLFKIFLYLAVLQEVSSKPQNRNAQKTSSTFQHPFTHGQLTLRTMLETILVNMQHCGKIIMQKMNDQKLYNSAVKFN